jgi:hypothetical protein
MSVFKIKKFIDPDGTSKLVKWHESLSEECQADFDAKMDYLTACNTTTGWSMPYCRPLGSGILEIRFKCKKVQQRPLGCFGPERYDFTFLFPAIEKGGSFIPKDAIERAKERKQIIEGDKGRANAWNIRVNE